MIDSVDAEVRDLFAGPAKRCPRCEITKPHAEFGKNRGRHDGLSVYCLICKASDEKKRRDADPVAHYAYRRGTDRKYRHGLTQEQYDARVAEQDGRCAVCGEIPDRPLFVDHDHATGKLRKLLCDLCNRGLGFFRDDPARMRAGAEYLEVHR